MLRELGRRAKFLVWRNRTGRWFGIRWAELSSGGGDSARRNRDSSCGNCDSSDWHSNSARRTSCSWRWHSNSARRYSDTSGWSPDARDCEPRHNAPSGIDSVRSAEWDTKHEYSGQHSSRTDSAFEPESA